jgi:hypothetical protein
MNDNNLEHSDEALLAPEISDEMLESAVINIGGAAQAMSFPNAPTVSILIMCCGNG